MYEGMDDQVFERSAEMILYVDCPSLDSKEVPEEQPLVWAMVRNVTLDTWHLEY